MRVFGLTGGIGAGKSAVARMFREAGIPVVDADRIAHDVTAPGRDAYREIVRSFGEEILLADGRIDRRKLGEKVFADPRLRSALEAATHPAIAEGIAAALAALEAAGHRAAIVEAALIHEAGRRGRFEAVIAVRCGRERQVERLMARDGISRDQALRRLSSQMDPEEKARASDHVIDNSGDLEATRSQVLALLRELRLR
jgi:dephospho-CoA kinase